MKKNLFVVSILAVILAVSCNTKGGGYSTTKPTKDVDSASYIIGVLMGKNLRNGQIDSTFNLDLIAQGIYDELNSKKFAIPFWSNSIKLEHSQRHSKPLPLHARRSMAL